MEEREKYVVVAIAVFAMFLLFLGLACDNKQENDFISQCHSIEKKLNGTIIYKTVYKCYIKTNNEIIKIER